MTITLEMAVFVAWVLSILGTILGVCHALSHTDGSQFPMPGAGGCAVALVSAVAGLFLSGTLAAMWFN